MLSNFGDAPAQTDPGRSVDDRSTCKFLHDRTRSVCAAAGGSATGSPPPAAHEAVEETGYRLSVWGPPPTGRVRGHISPAIRTRGVRYAAIGYLGQDAPALLPLRAGDLLVVNASKAAVRAYATSPTALAY